MPKAMSSNHKINVTLILLAPIIFYLITEENILSGESICLHKIVFKRECWGCGITRALYLILHNDLHTAISYNHLVILVFPLLVAIWFHMLIKEISILNGNNQFSKLKR